MWQISAGLGLVLAFTLGAFKLYYDKSQAELDAFQIRLEQSIQNRKKFSRHSLDVLSVRKPKLIENIINKGTKQVLNDLKTITDPYQFDETKPVTNTSAG